MENNSYHIRVTREGEYAYYSFYDVEAPNKEDAERMARKKFCADFGAPYENTKAYTFPKRPEA
jgi:hypothetical protein